MSTDGQDTKWRRNVTENFNRLRRTNITDDRRTDDSIERTSLKARIVLTLLTCFQKVRVIYSRVVYTSSWIAGSLRAVESGFKKPSFLFRLS